MKKQLGYSLYELLIAVTIAAILLIMAQATFGNAEIDCKNKDAKPGYITRARIANAQGALGGVFLKIDMFHLWKGRYPTSADDLKLGNDPWGNPYVFLSFGDVNGNGPKRKDHNMVPVNRYFDVYSMGPDGKTATPFTSIPGGDDIVIANDGNYIGVACYHYDKRK